MAAHLYYAQSSLVAEHHTVGEACGRLLVRGTQHLPQHRWGLQIAIDLLSHRVSWACTAATGRWPSVMLLFLLRSFQLS